MSYSVRVLCRPAVAAGFRLAGLAPLEADDAEEGGRRLAALLEAPDVGVVLVEEPFYAALPDAARRRLARQSLPMVVPFPGPEWLPPREGAEAFIAELLRQAIGYRVKLE
ncbi:MAG TPA: V-type ATP synthase subunit F [Gemmatimonadales bacterium]|jgi:vacuolar-type H+-ATPase subunit F/Vma7|nr:V-type ATP synthase subunit F [Gemmatimonadales bacterium]